MSNNLHLLSSRRFAPLFGAQFLGAFNDNLFKNALVMLITFRLAEQSGWNVALLLNIQAGLFILPFFLFSSLAGQFADKYDKPRIARIVKIVEIALAVLGSAGLFSGDAYLLFATLFLFGVHSTFFGPVKYAILPELLKKEELLAGNGFVEAGTLIAILLGTIAGGALTLLDNGAWYVAALTVAAAIVGLVCAQKLPGTPAANPTLALDWNIARDSWAIIRTARGNRPVFLSILCISWFWLIGASFLTLLPALAKEKLNSGPQVVTLFFTLFSVGIAVGSVLCAKIMRGRIGNFIVPWAAFGLCLFTADFWFLTGSYTLPAAMQTLPEFLAQPLHWRMIADLFLLSACGGIYAVPLYTILQDKSAPTERARMIGANNIMNALFMVMSALLSVKLLAMGLHLQDVLMLYAAMTAAIGLAVMFGWKE